MATDTAKTAKYAARGSFQILNDPKILIDPINAKPRDPSQTFLEKNFVYIPYDMRHAKDFPDRGSLPHHNEIAVDAPLGKDNQVPDAHKLYQTPQAYQDQFNLRFDAAKRHVAQEYERWKGEDKE